MSVWNQVRQASMVYSSLKTGRNWQRNIWQRSIWQRSQYRTKHLLFSSPYRQILYLWYICTNIVSVQRYPIVRVPLTDVFSRRSFFAKESLIIGLFSGKWAMKSWHSMGLGHPVGIYRMSLSLASNVSIGCLHVMATMNVSIACLYLMSTMNIR